MLEPTVELTSTITITVTEISEEAFTFTKSFMIKVEMPALENPVVEESLDVEEEKDPI